MRKMTGTENYTAQKIVSRDRTWEGGELISKVNYRQRRWQWNDYEGWANIMHNDEEQRLKPGRKLEKG